MRYRNLWYLVFLVPALFVVLAQVLPSNDDGGDSPPGAPADSGPLLQTDKGLEVSPPINYAIVTEDLIRLRFACDEAERILSPNDSDETEDWNLLVDVCNLGFRGDWAGAAARMIAIR